MRRGFLSIALLTPLLSCASSPAGRAPAEGTLALRIGAILDQPAYANARWGILVVEEPSGRTLFEHNARRSFMTASNMKLVSTAVALRVMGPDFTYPTGLYRTAEIRSGVLAGDLVLRGSGDPTFGGRMQDHPGQHLEEILAALRAAGIRVVAGRLIGDDDIQPDEVMGDGWAWDYQVAWYAAQFGGLDFGENTFRAIVERDPGGGGYRMRAEPPCTLLELKRPQIEEVASAEQRWMRFERERGTNRFHARGGLEAGGKPWSYSLAVENPTLYAVASLADALKAAGIELRGGFFDIDDLPGYHYERDAAHSLLEHRSAPLGAIVRTTNTVSQNLYAEQLLRTAARRAGRSGDIHGARELVAATLREIGADPTECFIADGSGLSRENLLTPRVLVALLRAMQAGSDGGLYLESLPRSGRSGTLGARLTELPDGIEVRAKTGSISLVKALSGHVLRDGRIAATFSILVNDTTRLEGSQVKVDIDRVVRAIVEDLGNR